MQRGVYPVPFDIVHADSFALHQTIFNTLIDRGAVSPSDLLLLTKGEMEGISGGTNTMQILKVPEPAENIETEGS